MEGGPPEAEMIKQKSVGWVGIFTDEEVITKEISGRVETLRGKREPGC